MIKERTLEILEEMLLIHSPSKQEKKMADYIIQFLENLSAEIYLDHCEDKYGGNTPVIFAKIPGKLEGPGYTLNGHMDVIQPNQNLKIIKEANIWRSDGTTTLGGDDKAGLSAILSAVEYIVQNNRPHRDLYFIFTPGEEQGMLGAKNIQWDQVHQHFDLAKNIIVVDNAGKADKVAYQAPTCYRFAIEIIGKKAHAGIEPEKGINAIQVASQIISKLPLLRIDQTTTANISKIEANFPNNVVPDRCQFTGEIRAHSDQTAKDILQKYENTIQEFINDYSFEYWCDYPVLQSKDNLTFVNQVIDAYNKVGVQAEAQIIGGGSDANFFAEEGFNAAIIGVGMQQVHTTEEYLEINELHHTTAALIELLTQSYI
ncbi:M20/M25/M40 family metallo-hydrolase [Ignavigranum ruoffiae]|uniref:M20/M25/M40 family metallo-hydrolase n=1 Tax=Ignavigranum ruoffiae TaxID=89093 RepID=UPI0024AE490C|nr:M20/M25/M40 family metallo-hydrolase [Ignavigranum ruoffiae]